MGSSLRVFKDPEFLAMSGSAFARAQAYSTVAIALALYAGIFDVSSTVEGLFGTAFALVQLVIVLPLGRAIDTGNAKRWLLFGLGLNVVVFFGFMLVSNVAGVIVMRVFQGIAASILWLTGSTVIGEIAGGDEQGLWLGTYNQVGAFSSLFGDLIGGAILALFGFTAAYSVLAGVTLIAGVLVYAVLRDNPGGRKDAEEATGRETLESLLSLASVRALVGFRFGLSFGKMAVITFLPIYAHTEFGMNPFIVGGLLAGGKLTKAITQGYVGDLTDRWGNKHLFIAMGAVLYAVGALLIPLAGFAEGVVPGVTVTVPDLPNAPSGAIELPPAFFVLSGAYMVCGVADSIRLPASMAMFVEEGERFDAVAGAFSLRSVAWKVGQVIGPVTVGYVWDGTSVGVAFGLASALIIAATVVFLVIYETPAPTAEPTVSD